MRFFAPFLACVLAITADAAAQTRPSSFHLVLDGQSAGALVNATTMQSEVSAEATVTMNPNFADPLFWSWLAPAVEGRDVKHTVTVLPILPNGHPGHAAQLANASIQKIVFPALDSAERSSVAFVVTATAPASAPIAPQLPSLVERQRATYLASTFKVTIDGMPTSRVASVAPVTFALQAQQLTAEVKPGIGLERSKTLPLQTPVRTAATASASPLVLRVPLADAAPYQQWLAAAPGTKRNGSVQYLQTSLHDGPTLSLRGLTIVRVSTDTALNRATIEMGIEGASLSP